MDLSSGGTYITDNSITAAKLTTTFYDGEWHDTLGHMDGTTYGWTEAVAGTGTIVQTTDTAITKVDCSGAGACQARALAPFSFELPDITSVTIGCYAKSLANGTSMNERMLYLGLGENAALSTNAVSLYKIESAPTTMKLWTGDGADTYSTGKTIAPGAWHHYKIVATSTSCSWYYDNVLQETNTTNIPTAALRPYFGTYGGNAAGAYSFVVKDLTMTLVRP